MSSQINLTDNNNSSKPTLKNIKKKINKNKPLSPSELEMTPSEMLAENNNNNNNNNNNKQSKYKAPLPQQHVKYTKTPLPPKPVQTKKFNNNNNNSNFNNNLNNNNSNLNNNNLNKFVQPKNSDNLLSEIEKLGEVLVRLLSQKRDIETKYDRVFKQREILKEKLIKIGSGNYHAQPHKPTPSVDELKLKGKDNLSRKELKALKLFEKMEIDSKGETFDSNISDEVLCELSDDELVDIDDVDEYYDNHYQESDEDLVDEDQEENHEQIKKLPVPQQQQQQQQPTVVNPMKQSQNQQAILDLEKELRKQNRKEKKMKKKAEKAKEREVKILSQQAKPKQPKQEHSAKHSGSVNDNNNNNNNNNSTQTPKRSRPNKFNSYVTKEQFEEGLSQGVYFYGTIRVNPKKYNDAYITSQGARCDTYVDGLKDRNRAFHMDVVGFQIIEDMKLWKKKPKSGQDEDEDEELAAIKDTTNGSYGDSGTIVLQSSTINDMIQKDKIEESFQKNIGEIDEETGELLIREELKGKIDEQNISNDEDETILFNQPNQNQNNNNTFLNIKLPESKPIPKQQTLPTQSLSKLDEYISKGLKSNLYVTVRVVYIVEAKHTSSHIGLIVDDPNSQIFATFLPVDTTLPKCLVFKESIPQYRTNPEQYKSSLVSVKYVNWKETSTYPSGNFRSMYGECGQIEPETKALLDEFQVDTSVFSKEVISCLPKITNASQFAISKKELERRRDLRSLDIVTIDPDTAKDLDDALHCIPLEDGNFEVGVHIADVSHFVKPGTALDKCAEKRATTVYLVQKAIPMLPSLLSEELCSLNMGVERYAFSVIWKLSPKGEVLDEWFGKSVIKSCSRLTYAAAQAIISNEIRDDWNQFNGKVRPEFGPNTPEHISRVIKSVMGLREIAKHMRAKRIENGAFTIHPSKLAFSLDERGNPVSTKVYPIYESNNLVEEFMLLANMRVAEKIAKSFPSNAMLRRHPNPNPTKLQNFLAFCTKHGWKIDSSSVSSFGESLRALKDTVSDPRILQAIQILSVRSMKLAEYFCSSEEDEEDWHHYALNVDFYTHFTSPIRRYADVIVHRLLEVACELETIDVQSVGSILQQIPSSEMVSRFALQCNEKKMLARKAQERSDKVFLCVLLQNTVTITHAVVLSTGINFLAVIVPEFGSEQRIYFDQLKGLKLIQNSTFNDKDQTNSVLWQPTEDQTAHTQVISELSIVKIKLEVNKEKFPIDTKCILVHPNL